jgi:uncharacterized Zn finger protein
MTNVNFQTNREWWSQRWLDLLDSYRFKKRLERGRTYARQGNVLSIEFKEARVFAKVQGSEPEPYEVSLSLDSFTDEEWGYVIETMSQKAVFAAKLLSGEMPQHMEDVFAANGLSLFPFTLSDVHSKCSCPDKANPCKHVAAIYYQLGDRFSEDPFVLFELRGRTKELIIKDLRNIRSGKYLETLDDNLREEKLSEMTEPTVIKQEQQYPVNINNFWTYDEPLESSLVVITPSGGENILDMLGSIPLGKDEEATSNSTSTDLVMKYLKTIYKDVSQKAMLVAMNIGN